MPAFFAIAAVLLACERREPTPPSPLPAEPRAPAPYVARQAIPPVVLPPMEGALRLETGGRVADVRYAFAVGHGGRSFTVYSSTQPKNCAWAEEGGIGVIEDDDVHVDFDVAPLFQHDGTLAWSVVGLTWVGSSRAGWSGANQGRLAIPAEVSASGDGSDRRIRVRAQRSEFSLEGDFVATGCTPGSPPPPDPPPMTARLGGEEFALLRASATPTESGLQFRVSRILQTCTSNTTHEDLYLEIFTRGRELEVHGVSAHGLVLPQLGIATELGLERVPIRASIEGELLTLEGRAQLGDRFDSRAPNLDLDVRGTVPIVRCPARD
jgi:hypothetical protein